MKLLPCEYPDCDKMSQIRSKVKDRNSEYYGSYVCNYHANILRPKKISDQTRRTREKRKEQRKDYPEFYQKWCEVARISKCLECNSQLQGLSTEIVHVLAKSTSPEVATNNQNILLLCGDCHTRFDSSLEKRSEMKCFNASVYHYLLLQPLLVNITAETKFYQNNLQESN